MRITRIVASVALGGALSVALGGAPALADDSPAAGVSASDNRDWSVAGTRVTADREYSGPADREYA